jgi:hypothetical protein
VDEGAEAGGWVVAGASEAATVVGVGHKAAVVQAKNTAAAAAAAGAAAGTAAGTAARNREGGGSGDFGSSNYRAAADPADEADGAAAAAQGELSHMDLSSSCKPYTKSRAGQELAQAPLQIGFKTCWQGFSNRSLELQYQQYKARQLLGLDLAVGLMKLAELVATVLKGMKLMKEHAGAAGVVRSVMLYLLFSVAPSLLLVTSPRLYWQMRDAVVFWSTVGSIIGAFPLAVVLYWLGVGLDMGLARDILGKIYQRPAAVISWVHLVVPLTLQLRVQRYLVILGLRVLEGWGVWWLVLKGVHSGGWLLGVMGGCAGLAVMLLLLLDLQLRRRFLRAGVRLEADKPEGTKDATGVGLHKNSSSSSGIGGSSRLKAE